MQYYILQNALLWRYAKRHTDEYDLLVSTITERGDSSFNARRAQRTCHAVSFPLVVK